ncbi:MAG TPA: DUF4433 domain-containing protein [Candidatus Melainabacteria bacterium]|nr:DUF4433 domain-containing protein [Candidatus Melainabacteria bacterium]
MTFQPPAEPKIYHIVHYDRLPSIISDGFIFSDFEVQQRQPGGTNIGMNKIKARRMINTLNSHTNLTDGQCVPFYFCPRSIMLYLIHKANHPDITYMGGQNNIVHLVSDLMQTVHWANSQQLRWAFSLSNAGANYFEDRADLQNLNEVNWPAVSSNTWSGNGVPPGIKEAKQSEFLVENRFPWTLVESIGIAQNTAVGNTVAQILNASVQRPQLNFQPTWYY